MSTPTVTAAFSKLSASVFGANLTGGARAGAATGMKGMLRKIPYYTWPTDIEEELKPTLLTALTLPGRSVSDSVTEWQTWVITWCCLCFDEVPGKIAATKTLEYVPEPLPAVFVEEVRAAEQELLAAPESSVQLAFPPGLPGTAVAYSARQWNCGTIKGVYGYFALIVHLMGKRVDASTRDNIVNRRPKNIMDKFLCHDLSYIMTGAGRMSDMAHTMIPQAWQESTLVRRLMIRELCTFKEADVLGPEIVNTLFQMLDYSGMQPVAFIHRLLEACPWVIEDIPVLRPAFAVYSQSLVSYAQMPAVERPYLKLLYGDTTKLFHSKSMVDLTACAVEYLKQYEPSMAGYTAPGGDKAKVLFMEAAQKRGIDVTGTGQKTQAATPESTT